MRAGPAITGGHESIRKRLPLVTVCPELDDLPAAVRDRLGADRYATLHAHGAALDLAAVLELVTAHGDDLPLP